MGAVFAVLWLVLPEFDMGATMNALLVIIPFPYRLVILLLLINISLVMTSYSFYKKQRRESFFEKNINDALRGLQHYIDKLNEWLDYKNQQPRGAMRKLREIISTETILAFTSYDPVNDLSIKDFFKNIVASLNDGNLKSSIESEYKSVEQKIEYIVYNYPEDSDSEAEQQKSIASFQVMISELILNVQTLSKSLKRCSKIIRERENKL